MVECTKDGSDRTEPRQERRRRRGSRGRRKNSVTSEESLADKDGNSKLALLQTGCIPDPILSSPRRKERSNSPHYHESDRRSARTSGDKKRAVEKRTNGKTSRTSSSPSKGRNTSSHHRRKSDHSRSERTSDEKRVETRDNDSSKAPQIAMMTSRPSLSPTKGRSGSPHQYKSDHTRSEKANDEKSVEKHDKDSKARQVGIMHRPSLSPTKRRSCSPHQYKSKDSKVNTNEADDSVLAFEAVSTKYRGEALVATAARHAIHRRRKSRSSSPHYLTPGKGNDRRQQNTEDCDASLAISSSTSIATIQPASPRIKGRNKLSPGIADSPQDSGIQARDLTDQSNKLGHFSPSSLKATKKKFRCTSLPISSVARLIAEKEVIITAAKEPRNSTSQRRRSENSDSVTKRKQSMSTAGRADDSSIPLSMKPPASPGSSSRRRIHTSQQSITPAVDGPKMLLNAEKARLSSTLIPPPSQKRSGGRGPTSSTTTSSTNRRYSLPDAISKTNWDKDECAPKSPAPRIVLTSLKKKLGAAGTPSSTTSSIREQLDALPFGNDDTTITDESATAIGTTKLTDSREPRSSSSPRTRTKIIAGTKTKKIKKTSRQSSTDMTSILNLSAPCILSLPDESIALERRSYHPRKFKSSMAKLSGKDPDQSFKEGPWTSASNVSEIRRTSYPTTLKTTKISVGEVSVSSHESKNGLQSGLPTKVDYEGEGSFSSMSYDNMSPRSPSGRKTIGGTLRSSGKSKKKKITSRFHNSWETHNDSFSSFVSGEDTVDSPFTPKSKCSSSRRHNRRSIASNGEGGDSFPSIAEQLANLPFAGNEDDWDNKNGTPDTKQRCINKENHVGGGFIDINDEAKEPSGKKWNNDDIAEEPTTPTTMGTASSRTINPASPDVMGEATGNPQNHLVAADVPNMPVWMLRLKQPHPYSYCYPSGSSVKIGNSNIARTPSTDRPKRSMSVQGIDDLPPFHRREEPTSLEQYVGYSTASATTSKNNSKPQSPSKSPSRSKVKSRNSLGSFFSLNNGIVGNESHIDVSRRLGIDTNTISSGSLANMPLLLPNSATSSSRLHQDPQPMEA